MSDPAALAVRNLGSFDRGCLGPGGEICGGVAVPVPDQSAITATKGPRPQRPCFATAPQAEQVLVEGNQRSQTTSSPPSQAVLYRSWRANSAHAASVMAWARRLLRIRLATGRSSMASPLWVLASWLETSWRKLRRMLAMRLCSRASERAAFNRFREPR